MRGLTLISAIEFISYSTIARDIQYNNFVDNFQYDLLDVFHFDSTRELFFKISCRGGQFIDLLCFGMQVDSIENIGLPSSVLKSSCPGSIRLCLPSNISKDVRVDSSLIYHWGAVLGFAIPSIHTEMITA